MLAPGPIFARHPFAFAFGLLADNSNPSQETPQPQLQQIHQFQVLQCDGCMASGKCCWHYLIDHLLQHTMLTFSLLQLQAAHVQSNGLHVCIIFDTNIKTKKCQYEIIIQSW